MSTNSEFNYLNRKVYDKHNLADPEFKFEVRQHQKNTTRPQTTELHDLLLPKRIKIKKLYLPK